MAENKARFVEKLADFYRVEVNEDFGIIGMRYTVDVHGNEWVLVEFHSGSRKKFDITGDSHQGILFDFVKFLANFNNYEWEI